MSETLASPANNYIGPVVEVGQPDAGGFFAGIIHIDGALYGLVVAPRDAGELAETDWIDGYKNVPGAQSWNDGLANTVAMAEAGSALAKWARGLEIGGFTDWYIPSQDELEICYRNLKPTTETNSLYARSGINLSAPEPTRPYTEESPAQTSATAFRAGGAEAFADDCYWTSTQHAADSGNAWYQDFYGGIQGNSFKSAELRARAVRRFPL